MTDKPNPRPVTIVRQSYQPSKAEMEKPIEFPEGTTPEDLVRAVVAPVKIDWKHRP